ncbi:MAG: hypothetical protein KC620_03970 [Myxococcales bacterium]|nr:hypothetical protein [Myxococcales bacterium]
MALALAAVVALSACDDAAEAPAAADMGWTGEVEVGDISAWQPVAAADDPFADHRPAEVDCPTDGYGREYTTFEVTTDSCHYATFAQPLPVDLRPGDHVVGSLWHLALYAPEAAEAHVALGVGAQVLWEQHIPIPGPEAVFDIDAVVAEAVPAGTPIFVHLHNHGANSWRWTNFEARR